MKCPHCSKEIFDLSEKCPYCREPVKKEEVILTPQSVIPKEQASVENITVSNPVHEVMPQKKTTEKRQQKKLSKKEMIFYVEVIVIGLVIFLILLLYRLKPKQKASLPATTTGEVTSTSITTSLNKGVLSSVSNPARIGSTVLSSIKLLNGHFIEVDVTGLKIIQSEEAISLAASINAGDLYPDFAWYGLEYRVTFNALNELSGGSLSPILHSEIKMQTGYNYVRRKGIKYPLKTFNIYSGENIHNKESANVIVLFQMPVDETYYSICLGEKESTIGCFEK